jgi:hypothetical protein
MHSPSSVPFRRPIPRVRVPRAPLAPDVHTCVFGLVIVMLLLTSVEDGGADGNGRRGRQRRGVGVVEVVLGRAEVGLSRADISLWFRVRQKAFCNRRREGEEVFVGGFVSR